MREGSRSVVLGFRYERAHGRWIPLYKSGFHLLGRGRGHRRASLESAAKGVIQTSGRVQGTPSDQTAPAGGETVEYSAHTIPEGGVRKVPPLSGDGYLLAGDAAGLALNALVTVRGLDFAIASGYHAARTVLSAREREDFSTTTLSGYDQALGE